MSILLGQNARIVIQGITGREGLFYTGQMIASRSNIVAGVTPGHGGDWVLDGKVPVFDSMRTAVDVTEADVSMIFVPARFAADAIYEACDAGIELIICVTDGIPVHDMMNVKAYLDTRHARLVGPNSCGIFNPGEVNASVIHPSIAQPGNIGVVSRSGTLTMEILSLLNKANLGVSSCVGIGSDPLVGTSFVDVLEQFEEDPHTDQIILVGEIGGGEEEKAADYIFHHCTKPVVAYVCGEVVPQGKMMGHAGAIIERNAGSAEEKRANLEAAGVRMARHAHEIVQYLINE